MEKSFDRSQLAHVDVSLRGMVDRSYDLCLYKCNESKDNSLRVCKQNCFKNIQVPYRYINHMARDNEENNYRKCLSQAPSFPNLSREDFMSCSNNLFQERIEALSNHTAEEATKIF